MARRPIPAQRVEEENIDDLGANREAYEAARAEADRAMEAIINNEMPEDLEGDINEDDHAVDSEHPAEGASSDSGEETQAEHGHSDASTPGLQVDDDEDPSLISLDDMDKQMMDRVRHYESTLYETASSQAKELEQQNILLQQRLNAATEMLEKKNRQEQEGWINQLEEAQREAIDKGDSISYQKITRALMQEYAKSAQASDPYRNPAGTMSPWMQEMPTPVHNNINQNPHVPYYNNGQMLPMHSPMISPVYSGQPLPAIYQHLYPHLYPQQQQQPAAEESQPHPAVAAQKQATPGLPPKKAKTSSGVGAYEKPRVARSSGGSESPLHQSEWDFITRQTWRDAKGNIITDDREKERMYRDANKGLF